MRLNEINGRYCLLKAEGGDKEMRKRILWLGLSFLLVAALVLASCAVEEEEEPAVGEPQYGGTLTLASGLWVGDPPSADMCDNLWPTPVYLGPVLDYLITGDVEKYGPRGTNEYPFTSPLYVPETLCGGGLVESWEVTADKIVFHIRPGVYWTGKEGVMESREYTAYDTEYSLNRYMDSHPPLSMLDPVPDWITSIYAESKYTCVVETTSYNANWKWLISTGWGNIQYAEEVVEAGASEWDNIVGTGPFMVKEYITGSAMVYDRNPDYWDTTTIDGVEYEIPFIDELVISIIPDESTQIAALRTGKIDLMGGFLSPVSLRYEATLRETSPDLAIEKAMGNWCHLLTFNILNSEIVDDENVRRALMIATDREALAESAWLEADLHSWPVSSKDPDIFTPFDELPASTQELYEYDPDLARDMIADEYPEGFPLILPIDAANTVWVDMVSMIADMWDEIGVTLDMQPMEAVALEELTSTGEGFDCFMWGEYNVQGLIALRSRVAMIDGVDPWFVDQYAEAEATADIAAQNALLKEMNWKAIGEVLHIPLGTPYDLLCSWPWVKNWYGETEESAWGSAQINARIWIDQDLKAELGY